MRGERHGHRRQVSRIVKRDDKNILLPGALGSESVHHRNPGIGACGAGDGGVEYRASFIIARPADTYVIKSRPFAVDSHNRGVTAAGAHPRQRTRLSGQLRRIGGQQHAHCARTGLHRNIRYRVSTRAAHVVGFGDSEAGILGPQTHVKTVGGAAKAGPGSSGEAIGIGGAGQDQFLEERSLRIGRHARIFLQNHRRIVARASKAFEHLELDAAAAIQFIPAHESVDTAERSAAFENAGVRRAGDISRRDADERIIARPAHIPAVHQREVIAQREHEPVRTAAVVVLRTGKIGGARAAHDHRATPAVARYTERRAGAIAAKHRTHGRARFRHPNN